MTVKVNFSSNKFIPNNMLNYRHLILSLGLMLIASSTLSSEKILDLYDFNSLEKAGKWMVVNDGVMGGVSQSQLSLGGEGSLLFEGSVSLDYGGGFASVRSIVNQLDAHEYQGISIKIKGDGNKYQLRLRQTSKADGVAFFPTFPN
jgi:monofunctional biosynthetic peptidoglycan transglycosylase